MIYAGAVERGEPIVLRSDHARQRLVGAVIGLELDCRNGWRLPAFADAVEPAAASTPGQAAAGQLLVSANANGRFSGKVFVNTPGDTTSVALDITLSGRFGNSVARGRLSAIGTVFDATSGATITTCATSGSGEFRAFRKIGVLYGGATAQGEPVVFRLNRARRRVSEFTFSWQSRCDHDWADLHLGFVWLAALRLSAAGSFGVTTRSFSGRFDGGANEFEYALRGTLSWTSAKGTLRPRYVGFDAAGALEGTCSPGAISWSAASG